jgi:hypothetical protein
MSDTATRTAAAAAIPEGFAEAGCRICEAIAGIDLSRYWRVDESAALRLPGRRHGRITVAPVAHSPYAGRDRGTVNGWLAARASEVAADEGITAYDLVITEEGGHPCVQVVLRRAASWLAGSRARRNGRRSN